MYFSCPPPPAREHLADAYHYTKGRVIPPQLICLHATAGTNSLELLSTGASRDRSAHRLIAKDGTNYILVNREDTAWANGPSHWYVSPGHTQPQLSAYLAIEMENLNTGHDPYPLAQVRSAAWTCVYWWSIYGFLPIVSHWNVQPNKSDPAGFPWLMFYNEVAAKLRDVLRVPPIVHMPSGA